MIKNITIIILTIITLSLIGNWHYNNTLAESMGGDLDVVKCPVCPDCKITAERIIRDNPMIDLSKYNNVTKFKIPDIENLEIEIGKDIWTKSELEAIK